MDANARAERARGLIMLRAVLDTVAEGSRGAGPPTTRGEPPLAAQLLDVAHRDPTPPRWQSCEPVSVLPRKTLKSEQRQAHGIDRIDAAQYGERCRGAEGPE